MRTVKSTTTTKPGPLHKDKTGKITPIKDLEASHLRNIIRWIERLSREGLTVRCGGGSCADDFWLEEDELFGEDVLRRLNHQAYVDELSSRIK